MNITPPFFGFLDGSANGLLQGWCYTPGKAHRDELEVWVDGELRAYILADQPRADVRTAGYGDGFSGFSVPVDNLVSRSGTYEIDVRLKGTSISIEGSPQRFQLQLRSESTFWRESALAYSQILKRVPRVLICGGVPCNDVGGGQRSAQLARAFHAAGWDVFYSYIFPSIDVSTGLEIPPSLVNFVKLQGKFSDHSPSEWLHVLGSGDLLIVEIPHQQYINLLDAAFERGLLSIYEIIDDWESSLGAGWYVSGANSRAVRAATITTYTAHSLKPQSKEESVYLPNAVDLEYFDPYIVHDRPADLPIAKSLFLYFGSLYGEWFWWEALLKAADMNQDAAFVLVGDPPPTAPKRPNLFYLGSKLNSDLAAYLSHSDATICPFRPSKLSASVSPIKIFEYLASHRSCVASGTEDVRDYPGIYYAETESGFARFCKIIASRKSIATDAVEFDKFSIKNTWHTRIEKILMSAENLGVCPSWTPLKPLIKENSPPYAIIILCRNNETIIGRCLDSLRCQFDVGELQIVVVDNDSQDGSIGILNSRQDIILLKNPKNGCSSGRNIALDVVRSKYVGFLDSDQYVSGRGWLLEAVAVLDGHPMVGAVGWAAGWFGIDQNAGPIAEHMLDKGKNDIHHNCGFRLDIGYLGTGGMIMRRTDAEKIGRFDEAFDPTCFEDTDWSFRIKANGLYLAYMRHPTLLHQAHQTTSASSTSASYRELFMRNAEYFKKKYAGRLSLYEPVWRS